MPLRAAESPGGRTASREQLSPSRFACMRISAKLITVLYALSATAGFGAEMGEYKVKALFLYNIAQFIQWPDDSFKDRQFAHPSSLHLWNPTPLTTYWSAPWTKK